MSTHKHIDKICCVAVVLALVITVLFMNGQSLGIVSAGKTMGYENRLFNTEKVHTIDIVMNDWDSFIKTCENEEYSPCSVIIDGENYANIGIRAKGNTSLSSVSSMGSNRYSFKLEFDQYDNTKSYYGLDKISLNNIIQDNTFMKDYLTYRMMGEFGVAAPLCSYVYITVNGKDFGLYLAIEGVEDGFLQRNYGKDYGELYKPDSMSFGGGRGNGKDFDFSDFENENGEFDFSKIGNGEIDFSTIENGEFDFSTIENGEFDFSQFEGSVPTPPGDSGGSEMPSGGFNPFGGEMPDFSQMPDMSQMPEGFGGENMPDMGGFGGFGGMGSSDVKLQYTDDSFDSYQNIFDNAKTDVTDADKTRLIESLKTLSSGENIESAANIEQVIKYFVVHNFVVNGDSYTGAMIHNYYLYEKDGVMEMIPWDYNLAFGTFMSTDASGTINGSIDSPVSGDMSDRPMISWIFDNEEYTDLYHEYFTQFINEFFSNGYVEEIIDKTVEMISPYVEKDPTKFCDYDSFVLGASTIKQFCLLRAESISGQLGLSESDTVDTSGIDLSAMGTMSMGGRGGTSDMPQGGKRPETNPNGQTAPESDTPADNSASTPEANGNFPGFNGQIPGMPEGFDPSGGQMPEFNGEFPANLPNGFNPFGNDEGTNPET